MTDEILTDATREAARAQAEQLDREIHGAWRAGYNYLHVYMPMVTPHRDGRGEFAIKTYVLPTYSEVPPRPDGLSYAHSYDLTELTRERIEEVL